MHMLNIYICENDDLQRLMLGNHIESTIEQLGIRGKTVLTKNPEELLFHINENNAESNLYFIETEFENAMNGITLASEIRYYDKRCMIVFVTTHIELMSLTFEHHIEALDFILKTDETILKRKIETCIKLAHDRLLSNEESEIIFKIGRQTITEKLENIISFQKEEHNPHKVIMYTSDGNQAFYGSLSEIEKMDVSFFRCHRNTIVNIRNIKEVQSYGSIMMKNGSICLGSTRKIKELTELLKPRNGVTNKFK